VGKNRQKKGVRHSFISSTELNAMLTRFLLFIFFRYNFYSLVGDFDLLIAFVKEKVGQGQPLDTKRVSKKGVTKKGVTKRVSKKGVRHSFMHFLILTRSTSPEVECIQRS